MTSPLLFHVSTTDHQPGDNLSPGFYGAGARIPTGGAPSIEPTQLGALLWEFTLETARLAVAPSAPSRLRCLFAAETLGMARTFRDRFRSSAQIYSVQPWADAVLFRGAFSIVTDVDPAAPFIHYMPAEALRYWTEPPGEQVEVIVGGCMTVVGLVD